MKTYLENLGQLARTVLGEPGGGAAAGAAADAEVEVEAAPTSPETTADTATGPAMLEPVTPEQPSVPPDNKRSAPSPEQSANRRRRKSSGSMQPRIL